jgi:hypothetical protein
MSRILRRPMFRGGKVDSRGTGITSNLGYENGGRVGYQSAGFVTGQQIIDANRNNPFFQTNTLNPRSRFTLGQSRGGLDNLIRATMFDTEQFPLVGKEAGLSETASLTDLYKAQTDDDDAGGLLASIDTTFTPKINTKAEASEGEIEIEEKDDDPKTEIIDNSPKKVKTPKPGDDEPEVTMTDLEKALGLDRARQEYAADALAAASKAFFEGKGFGAIADAAAVKSKAPDIKRVAALEEFKMKGAKDIAQLRKQQKEFAPGNFEKNDKYLQKKYPKMDERERLKILQKKPSTFAEQYIELSKDFGYKNADIFKDAAFLYFGNDYISDVATDGDMTIGEPTPTLSDGIYTDAANELVFVVKDKKVTSRKKF